MTSVQNPLIKSAVNGFLLNTKSKTTKTIQKMKLRSFCEFIFGSDDLLGVDWTKLDRENILPFIDFKIETIKFYTGNNYITVIKLFARECFYHGVIDSFTYILIKNIKVRHLKMDVH